MQFLQHYGCTFFLFTRLSFSEYIVKRGNHIICACLMTTNLSTLSQPSLKLVLFNIPIKYTFLEALLFKSQPIQ